jgi:hypothetical protein
MAEVYHIIERLTIYSVIFFPNFSPIEFVISATTTTTLILKPTV